MHENEVHLPNTFYTISDKCTHLSQHSCCLVRYSIAVGHCKYSSTAVLGVVSVQQYSCVEKIAEEHLSAEKIAEEHSW